jgi:hypothetical protein
MQKAIEFYREHGYYRSDAIIPVELLDSALDAIGRFYAGIADHAAPPGITPGWKPGDSDLALRKNDFASFQVDALAALIRHPPLGEIAAHLVGEPVRLWVDQLLYKPPDQPGVEGNVGWHTDRRYWRCCTSTEMLTAWIPFYDCSEREGTLTVMDRSHQWPDNADSADFRDQDLDSPEDRFVTGSQPVTKVPVELRRGQVSFHHCLTMHGSGPNKSDLPRVALAVHMQPASNRWREFIYRMPDGTTRNHDVEVLCRRRDGVPDYTDPAICPQLWPV